MTDATDTATRRRNNVLSASQQRALIEWLRKHAGTEVVRQALPAIATAAREDLGFDVSASNVSTLAAAWEVEVGKLPPAAQADLFDEVRALQVRMEQAAEVTQKRVQALERRHHDLTQRVAALEQARVRLPWAPPRQPVGDPLSPRYTLQADVDPGVVGKATTDNEAEG